MNTKNKGKEKTIFIYKNKKSGKVLPLPLQKYLK